MRSGDRPAGNTTATDQSAADSRATGKLEDIDAGRSAAAVQPTGQRAAAPASGAPGPEPDGDSPWPADRPWPEDDPGPGENAAGEAETAGVTPAEEGGPGPDLAGGPGGAAGGTGFARITVLPAILVMAWLLPGLPLLLAGVLLPVPMLLIAAPLAVALVAFGLRTVPAFWPRVLAAGPGAASPRPDRGWSAWWGLAGTIAVAGGFALWQFLFNSGSVIVLRDPGAYLQTGYWIAQHGSLPIPQSLASFGGAHPGLGFSSIGFASRGSSVVPGLMSGLPLLLAGAFWVHGLPAAAAMGPVLGGLAVLAFGGLAGRLAGPPWAPAGALVLALTLPEQYASRGSFSETAAQVLLFGGLCLVADALTLGGAHQVPATRAPAAPAPEEPGDLAPAGPPGGEPAPAAGWRAAWRARWARWSTPPGAMMALGGLALGLCAVVRVDGLLTALPAIPFAGVLLARRSPTVLPFCIGLAIGAVYGLAGGYLLAGPFLAGLQPMPELIGLIAAWLAAMTLAGAEMLRLPGFRASLKKLVAARPLRWLPEAGGGLAGAALIGLAVRPYLQTVREPVSRATAYYVGHLQRLEHLPADPGRLYAEDTLYWVIWYIGLPAVLLGGFGVAFLIRRCLRALLAWRGPPGEARVWALPIMVVCCGSAAVLWQPHTVPDQPWASRRLVPLVLPGLILCAIWASAWLRQRARSRGASRTAASVVAAFCVAALLVPTVATSFGLGLTHAAPGGSLRPSADGLALKRTGTGEVGAVAALCSSLGPAASVLIVDQQVAAQFTQVIRGMCGVPVGWMIAQPPAAVQDVLSGIGRAGRRPVLLGARPSELSPYGGSPVRVLNLSTTQDAHTLTQPPTTLWPARYVIWMSTPGGFGARV